MEHNVLQHVCVGDWIRDDQFCKDTTEFFRSIYVENVPSCCNHCSCLHWQGKQEGHFMWKSGWDVGAQMEDHLSHGLQHMQFQAMQWWYWYKVRVENNMLHQ